MIRKLSTAFAVSAGILFVLTGALKILAAAPGESSLEGRRAFAQMLLQIGVPLPFLVAAFIPTLEVGGGIGLIANKGARIWAFLLACDMIGAMLLVGIPGKMGREVSIGQTQIGGESWRLPLEIVLLLMMIWLFIYPRPTKTV